MVSMNKALVIALITGLFIYYRTLDYYKTLPRKNLVVALLIVVWTYSAIKEPWFIIIGLIALNVYGVKCNF